MADVTFRVDESERRELVARAAREKVNLSDYIRVRLGLRAHGSDDEPAIDTQAQLADHERRLQAIEARLP